LSPSEIVESESNFATGTARFVGLPKETITILLCEMDWYLAGAQLVSTIAYPDARDQAERARFEQALVRWTLEWRIREDDNWAREPNILRPAYFSAPEKQHDAILKRGNKRLKERWVAAHFVAMPHFRAVESGKIQRPEGLAPTVNNMSVLATEYLNLSTESVSTFKSRMWAPSRSVIHAAAAVLVWDTFYWKKQGRNPSTDRKLAMMLLPEMVEEIVDISEELRCLLPAITQFKIKENETIKFETVRSSNSGRFLQLPYEG
jgi:hypothetical protein